jgi:hypothetical protein
VACLLLMGDKTSKVALGLSVLSILASGGIAFFNFYGQTLLLESQETGNLAVAGAQTAASAGQLCINWATFVDTQRRAGLTDEQIDRTGQVIFGTSDVLLVEVVKTLNGNYVGSKSITPRDVQAKFDAVLAEVKAAQPANSIVVPNFSNGFSILSFCGSAETLRAARDGKKRIVPFENLPSPPADSPLRDVRGGG